MHAKQRTTSPEKPIGAGQDEFKTCATCGARINIGQLVKRKLYCIKHGKQEIAAVQSKRDSKGKNN